MYIYKHICMNKATPNDKGNFWIQLLVMIISYFKNFEDAITH